MADLADDDLIICSQGKSLRFKTRNMPAYPVNQLDERYANILSAELLRSTERFNAEEIVRVYIDVGRKLNSPQVIKNCLMFSHP